MAALEKDIWELFYDGSRRLQFFADALYMPVDQLNFVVSQLIAIALAYVLRTRLAPLSKGATQADEASRCRQRHSFALVSGLLLTYFCFGKQIMLAVFLGVVCYLALLLSPSNVLHQVTLGVCVTVLSATHIYRQALQQGSFVIDITGALMMIVQRASSLSFALHDGMVKPPDQMTKMQARSAIKTCPSALEYFSYLFSFQSLLAGPFIMFKDYQDFMAGSDQFAKAVIEQRFTEQKQLKEKQESVSVTTPSVPELDTDKVALRKLSLGLMYALSTVLVASHFSVHFLTSGEYQSYSFLGKVLYLMVCTTFARHIYYAAWLLAESACNMGGLGYTGYDVTTAKHKWGGASNVNILGVEFGTNLREILDSWNCTTALWLRYAAYERLPKKWQVVGTYALSSSWHGFYPGYFCCFFIGALGTYAARLVRKWLRPLVIAYQGGESGAVVYLYHLLTWCAGHLLLAYGVFSFGLLYLQPILGVYSGLYYFVHVSCIAAIVIVPQIAPSTRRTAPPAEKSHTNGTAMKEVKEEKTS